MGDSRPRSPIEMNSHIFNSVDRLLFGVPGASSYQRVQCRGNKEYQAGSWREDGRRGSKTSVSTGHWSGSTELTLRTSTPTQRSPMRWRFPNHFRQTLNPSSSQNQNQSSLWNHQTQSQSNRWNRSSSYHWYSRQFGLVRAMRGTYLLEPSAAAWNASNVLFPVAGALILKVHQPYRFRGIRDTSTLTP
jgi:hypothetical protein